QKRRRYSDAFRRQVIAETGQQGTSVSQVSRRHDLNANMVFKLCDNLPILQYSRSATHCGNDSANPIKTGRNIPACVFHSRSVSPPLVRSEEHTSELQSRFDLV